MFAATIAFLAGVVVGVVCKFLGMRLEVHDGKEFTKGQQGGEVKDAGGGLRVTLSEKAGQRDAT